MSRCTRWGRGFPALLTSRNQPFRRTANIQIAASFIRLAREREEIRRRREAGQSWPWTSDPILQAYKFCNVRREDDRVSRGIANMVSQPCADHPDAWFPLVVARRAVNWPDTLADLMAENALLPWRPDVFLGVIRRRQAAGLGECIRSPSLQSARERQIRRAGRTYL